MAKLTGAEGGGVYGAAEQFVDRCWRQDRSLFTPAAAIWNEENLEELHLHFVQAPDVPGSSFLEKLEVQMREASPAAVQLMAEVLYAHLLIVASISGSSKRSTIGTVLGWMPNPPALPADLDRALEGGLAHPGQHFLARRDVHLAYLVRAAIAWRSLEAAQRSALLEDPWAFRSWAFGVDADRATSAQRSALLHLVHPDAFDPVLSDAHKDLIIEAFLDRVVSPNGDDDRKLFEIRQSLAPELGADFDWYAPELRRRWRPDVAADLSPAMRGRRVHRYGELRAEWQRDANRVDAYAAECEREAAGREGVATAIAQLRADHDVEAFVHRSVAAPTVSRHLPVRQFLLRLATRAGGDRAVGERLARMVALPASDADAGDQIHALRRLVQQLGAAKPLSVGASGLVLSALWATLDPARFPIYYADAHAAATALGWMPSGDRRHVEYWQLVRELDPDEPRRAVQVLSWAAHHFAGLPDDLAELCRANAASANGFLADAKAYPTVEEDQLSRERAEALVGEASLVKRSLKRRLAELLGTTRAVPARARSGAGVPYRRDAYVRFELDGTVPACDVRLWFTVDGVAFGLWPKWETNDAVVEARDRILADRPDGLDVLRYTTAGDATTFEVVDGLPGGAFLLGRQFDAHDATGSGFLAAIEDVAAALAPVVARLRRAEHDLIESGVDSTGADPALAEDIDHIQLAADDLLVDRVHLDEIVEMLDEKRQVILYGPPGTGKTFLARRLAMALTEDHPDRWQLVQFHPSSSYEDFFEGYRPAATDGAGVRYELTAGPLARMAAMAAEAPDLIHVLVIDEINRANIPKVFGELLYLLEYRDQPVRTLYRPDRDFRLPPNLKIIGTMNTADRSIGLVDAAMRRRFRFIGFFPDTEPMDGLLERWLAANDEPAWVADLVASVNLELVDDLGRHLQLGPSFFMSRRLDVERMAKIWKHSVEPFVEDQFFGDQARIDRYSWDEVWRRHNPQGGGDSEHGETGAER